MQYTPRNKISSGRRMARVFYDSTYSSIQEDISGMPISSLAIEFFNFYGSSLKKCSNFLISDK